MQTGMDCSIIRGVVDATRNEGASPCPLCHHTSIGARLGAVFGPAARTPDEPSARLPPPSHSRPGLRLEEEPPSARGEGLDWRDQREREARAADSGLEVDRAEDGLLLAQRPQETRVVHRKGGCANRL